MTIQRQYNLPNCQLIVEGVGDGVTLGRPLVSMVTHVECHFTGQEHPLTGGRDMLEALVKVVSEYAQEYLSGLSHPVAHASHRGKPQLVHLEKIDSNLHRLTVQPLINNDTKATATITPGQLDLTTGQLFDLVEAVDQFFADAQTLPELALTVAPLPKRLATSQEPVAKRALPAVLGLSGLTVAAIALFFLPSPQIKRPEPSSKTAAVTGTASPGASPGASPSPASSSPAAAASPSPSPSPVAASPVASPTASPVASPTTSPTASPTTSPSASPASPTASPSPSPASSTPPAQIDAILQNSPEITDLGTLDRLTAQLQEQLYTAWNQKPAPTFTDNLEYRVGVSQTGTIVGYKYANDPALANVSQIPLSDLRFTPPSPTASPGAIAQFRVVFTPEGVIEVSPWNGIEPSQPSAP